MSGGLAVENLTFNQTARRPLPETAPCVYRGRDFSGKRKAGKSRNGNIRDISGTGIAPDVITVNYRQIYKFPAGGANYDRRP